ncbi:MAG: hypothetical protein JNL03_06340 [Prolixibacteraceae bacterium]|nr:hypothetical protein [Prolixibacteraceae bacterium]
MRKVILIIVIIFTQLGCLDEKQQAEKVLSHYINQKVEMIRSYSIESAVALWNATVSGNETDYQKLIEIELDFNKHNQNSSNLFAPDRFDTFAQNVFTNEQDFLLLHKLKYSGLITDTLLSRQLNVLYQAFMGTQIEAGKYKKLIMNEVKLWQAFSAKKVEIDGKEYGAEQIDSIRKNTTDSALLKKISAALQRKGKLLAADIIRMVKDRNEFARNFGYPDYYHMALEAKDQTPEQVRTLLDDIEQKTREPFLAMKQTMDQQLANRFRIPAGDLKFWHCNDERSSYLPEKLTLKMDSLFAQADPVHKAALFFEEIGLPIQDVIDRSDLKDSPGKSDITGMVNIDFKNDIRLIASVKKSLDGMRKMLHLGGHASNYKLISDDVPYLLRTPNSVIAEGTAMYFENLVYDYEWFKNEISDDRGEHRQFFQIYRHLHQIDRLVKCRRFMVMSAFEQEIYRDPDQDLDVLWRDLNLKYLGVDIPGEKNACFWAASKFATSLSCTIHNMVLADIFAAQLQHSVEIRVLDRTSGSFRISQEVGNYMVSNIFRYGNLLPWEQIIVKATGEPLNPSYFMANLLGSDLTLAEGYFQN